MHSVDVTSAPGDAAGAVVWRDEPVMGQVTVAEGGAYLDLLDRLGVAQHASVPWRRGPLRLGLLAVYDPPGDGFDDAVLAAVRAAGFATALAGSVDTATVAAAPAPEHAGVERVSLGATGNGATTDDPNAVLGAAARIAAEIVSRPGVPSRRASFLLLEGDVLTSVAEYDETGEEIGGHYPLADFPGLARAVAEGEVVVGNFQDTRLLSPQVAAVVNRHRLAQAAMVPVRSSGVVVGILAVGARDGAGFSDAQLQQLAMVANIVGLGIGHAATAGALREEVERSQGLENLKGEFLNIAAHELRSPLGIINGYVSMLLEGILSDADQNAALTRIAEKTDEMSRLITEMLDTARMEAMGVDLSMGAVDLQDVLSDAMTAIQPLLRSNHHVVMHGLTDPLLVIADRPRLAAALTNLIDNAIKYSPEGGDIEVASERIAELARIRVTDHGVGISEEQLPMLFTRFGRLVTPETSHIRGTGLGLYLARETARLHGGDITVESAPGEGTTFTLTMPLQALAT